MAASAKHRIAEHHERAEMNAQHDSERIEGLREVEPEMADASAAEIGGKRICRDLQCGEARGEHEQSREDRPESCRSPC